ncbi:MAG TPA: ATP-binding cassette domain-containing protein [Acidimicrobiales bacterium]|nr:ATP-binding cassette domain-containing protein [Acidimicrobiales bacterium]
MSLLQLKDVSKKFGQVVVSKETSFQLEQGDAVGIVGPNGAGKTSLFSMISGDIALDSGEILLDGRSLARVSAAKRARGGIGRTYQVPRPFENMTVFENALLGAQQGARVRGQKSYALAYDALERTGLSDFANRQAGTLTLLYRKRLELARTLATSPRVLLLDEIAGGLTDLEVNELTGIIRGLRTEGIAVVWIEHVVRALINTVDRLLCLSGGVVVADGEPKSVLASDAVRAVYLGGRAVGIAAANE